MSSTITSGVLWAENRSGVPSVALASVHLDLRRCTSSFLSVRPFFSGAFICSGVPSFSLVYLHLLQLLHELSLGRCSLHRGHLRLKLHDGCVLSEAQRRKGVPVVLHLWPNGAKKIRSEGGWGEGEGGRGDTALVHKT